MNKPAPILLFVYNRPDHVERCIASLLANAEAAESDLYVFSDGPRTAMDVAAVTAVRTSIARVRGFARVRLTTRPSNVGLAANIIDGVTAIVNRYGRVIVMEDDLVAAPYFLRFMNDALETYQDEERVGHIQACDFTNDQRLPETFLIKWTGSWGWGTWKRAWQHFNPDGAALLQELKRRGLERRFDFNGKYGFTKMLRRQVEGKNNSWAVRWNASLFLDDILSLNVGRSLIRNEGFDGTGTHCGSDDIYAADLWMKPIEVKRIEPVEENKLARRCFEAYYGRTNSFMAKACRRLRRLLRGDFGA